MKRNPGRGKLLTVFYHDMFDYPLTSGELGRWEINRDLGFKIQDLRIEDRKGYYFLEGREEIVPKRLIREKTSKEKLKIAKRAGRLLKHIPTVKFVGITGSLAMMNSNDNSDIDLIIITSENTLWTTRLITYFLLLVSGLSVRRPRNKEEKDRLCLNMWLDESSLVFTKRNIFTAHEVAQIVSLVNKDGIYERLLWDNRWILDYWPKAVKVSSTKYVESRMGRDFLRTTCYMLLTTIIEPLAFKLQYLYMKPKITREVITPTRAFFHPTDWSRKIINVLDKQSL